MRSVPRSELAPVTGPLHVQPDLAVVYCLDHEIASGRGVIVLDPSPHGGAPLSSRIRQVAHLSGREHDLAIIDLTPGKAAARWNRFARKLDRGEDAGPSDILPLLAYPGTGRRLPGSPSDFGPYDPRPTNHLLRLTDAELALGRTILVLRGSVTDVAHAATWAIGAVRNARSGRIPLTFGSSPGVAKAAGALGWLSVSDATLTMAGPHNAMRENLVHADGGFDQALDDPAILLEEHADGCAVITDGRMTVAAARVWTPKGSLAVLVDIEEHGWCDIAWFRASSGIDGELLAELARAGWMGGVEIASDLPADLGERLREATYAGHKFFLPFLRGDGKGDRHVPPSLSRLLAERTDVELQRACMAAREPARLHLWATSPGQAGERRRQFVRSFPALCEMGLDADVSDAIDDGEPLTPILSRRLGIKPGTLRKLSGQPRFPGAPYPGYESPSWGNAGRDRGVAVLTALGHDHLPSRGEKAQWDALISCLWYLDLIRSRNLPGGLSAERRARLLLAMPGPWTARRARFEDLSITAVRDVSDMVSAFGEALLRAVPKVFVLSTNSVTNLMRAAEGTALEIMAEHGTVNRMCHASASWHRHPVLSRGFGALAPEVTWPVPFGSVDLGEGWTAICLSSSADLFDEGGNGPDRQGVEGLGHCAATYGTACQEGKAIVISLRQGEGGDMRRIATIELSPAPNRFPKTPGWEIEGHSHTLIQVRGRRNSEPDAECLTVLENLRVVLSGGLIEIDTHALGLRPSLEERSMPRPMEWLELWRPLLPGTWSGMTPDGIAARVEAMHE